MTYRPIVGRSQERTSPFPTIEKLSEHEKPFEECFAEATLPVLLWLNQFSSDEDRLNFGLLKEYLQSQALPTIPDLRNTHPSDWNALYNERIHLFRSRADKPLNAEQKEALDHAVQDRRVMSGMQAPRDRAQAALPRFFLTEAKGRDFCYRLEHGAMLQSVADPRPFTYRINIPDAPGELREVILSRVAQKLWREPVFKEYGFQAKILGFAKTDGLIFYVCDAAVNEALAIIQNDALKHGYGSGEPARFGQAVDARIPGLTVTTNPKDEQGKTAGTFGDVVGELLAASLKEALRRSRTTPHRLINELLGFNAGDWVADVLEPAFTEVASMKFGKRLNTHNLAFIDKG